MARLNYVKSFRGTSKTTDRMLTCQSCGDKIKVGDGYRWWANRAPGQRGSYRRIRCMKDTCTPSIADRTPGRRGQWYGLLDSFSKELSAATTIEELKAAAESIADEVRSFGEEFGEAADNMEDGFGHATQQSDELRERGDEIVSAADEIESVEADTGLDEEPGEWDRDEAEARFLAENFDGRDRADLFGDELDELNDLLNGDENEHENEVAQWEQDAEQAIESFRDEIQEKIDEVEV